MALISDSNQFLFLLLIVLSGLLLVVVPSADAGRTLLSRPCNFTEYPKSGCEDFVNSECVNKVCVCRENFPVVNMNYCFESSCSGDQYYDNFERRCYPKRKASPLPEDSHCQFTYQCKGSNVRCKRIGWNNNCICDPGFRYDQHSGNCMPTYGIGGHCNTDFDCDDTGLRNMVCLVVPSHRDLGPNQPIRAPTCQCQREFQFNYQVDGCEPLTEVASRKNQFRTLIIIFVIAGIMFGFAMSCNFSLCGGGTGSGQGSAQARMMAVQHIQQQMEKQRKDMLTKAMNNDSNQNGTVKIGLEDGGDIDDHNDDNDRLDTVDSIQEKIGPLPDSDTATDKQKNKVLIAL